MSPEFLFLATYSLVIVGVQDKGSQLCVSICVKRTPVQITPIFFRCHSIEARPVEPRGYWRSRHFCEFSEMDSDEDLRWGSADRPHLPCACQIATGSHLWLASVVCPPLAIEAQTEAYAILNRTWTVDPDHENDESRPHDLAEESEASADSSEVIW